jgi:hypothetical protein
VVSCVRPAIWLLAAVPACFHPSYDHPACGPGGACPGGLTCNAAGFCDRPGTDAGGELDASPGGPDGDVTRVCLGTFVKVCADMPSGSLGLMTGTIDTSDVSTSTKCLPSTAYTTDPAIDACVIAGQMITIPSGNTISVTGGRRLILLADDVLTISGMLDAASHRTGVSGPAADSGPCPTNVTTPTTATEGGGGWGGTFGRTGNNGGNTPGGGLGGLAGSQLLITAPGGGCRGGAGANNSSGSGGGVGGHGGGAVLLLAGQSITIDGAVNASGAGGSGGQARGGGGGGGAGGMIILEAPMVRILGTCFANGGGGGEGSSQLADGTSGGESSAPDIAGGGGSSLSVGGDGGAGGVGTTGSTPGSSGGSFTSTNPPITDTGGGGAGGGGVGIIKILSADPGTTSDPKTVSPPPS